MLNRNRPYNAVYGGGSTIFEQDGILYRPNGMPVHGEAQATAPLPVVPAKRGPGRPRKEPPVTAFRNVPFEDMTDDELQDLVETTGGEFVGREEALAHLKGARA